MICFRVRSNVDVGAGAPLGSPKYRADISGCGRGKPCLGKRSTSERTGACFYYDVKSAGRLNAKVDRRECVDAKRFQKLNKSAESGA